MKTMVLLCALISLHSAAWANEEKPKDGNLFSWEDVREKVRPILRFGGSMDVLSIDDDGFPIQWNPGLSTPGFNASAAIRFADTLDLGCEVERGFAGDFKFNDDVIRNIYGAGKSCFIQVRLKKQIFYNIGGENSGDFLKIGAGVIDLTRGLGESDMIYIRLVKEENLFRNEDRFGLRGFIESGFAYFDQTAEVDGANLLDDNYVQFQLRFGVQLD